MVVPPETPVNVDYASGCQSGYQRSQLDMSPYPARKLHTNLRRAIRVGRLRAGGGSVATLEGPVGSIWATGKPCVLETAHVLLACTVHSGANAAGMDCTREAYTQDYETSAV